MKQGTFEKEIFIRSNAAAVLGIVSDLSNHHKVHPLIVKVERAQNEPPGVKRYFITDSLQWGPFKFKIKYQADILSITSAAVQIEAHQSPNTHITNITKVTPKEDGVILKETVTIKAPDLLFSYAYRQAGTAHEEMLERVKQFVEQGDNC